MSGYTFDVKVFVTVHVTAEDERAARAIIDDRLVGLLEGAMGYGGEDGELPPNIVVNSASIDGENDLLEIDGEAV